MRSVYASLDGLKAHLGITSSADDLLLLALLDAASRQIENFTKHQFFVSEATRYFTPRSSDYLLLGTDLLEVTSLATDADGGRTYPDAWEPTDYDLEPIDNPALMPPAPYWKIAPAPNGRHGFPCVPRGVRIVGAWGYYEVRERAETTLAQAADATQTTIKVNPGSAAQVGLTLLIDDEQLFVTDYNGTTATVERGHNGTTAAAHLNNSPIDVYRFPIVAEACLLQAGRLWFRKDTPGGFAGSPSEMGTVQLRGGCDVDVKALLAPIKRW